MKKSSESSPLVERLVQSDEISREEDERLLAETMREIASRGDDVDLSDMPEVTDFTGAVRGKFYRPHKDQVTLRIDRDVLAWFRQTEDKYQTAINAALREHMDKHRKAS